MAGWLSTLGNVGKTLQTAQSVKKGLTKKKDKKKSGKEVASAITKRDPEEKKDAIIKSRTITISKEKLLNVAPPAEEPDTKKTSSGGPLVKVLDNINETFGGMIKATKDESKLAKTQQKDAARRDDKDKKKTREGVLEKIGKTGATMVGKATAPVKGMWETLKTFFGNILIGSILTMILENWNKIVEQIEKAVEKIKEVWKMLEPILTPIWDVGKWFFVEGVKLTAQLMGVENADTSAVTNNLSAIMKKIPFVGGLFENFLGVRKELDGKGSKGDTGEKDATMDSEESNIMPSMHHDAPPPPPEVRSAGNAVDSAKDLIRNKEGFIEDAKWDVNAYRAGYGSDTYTTEDGQVHKVTSTTKVSREDAERDLSRRTKEFMGIAANQVGREKFASFPVPVQSALTSIAYNYGSLPERILPAVQSGDLNKMAKAVESLKTDDKGINAKRRQHEANMIRNARLGDKTSKSDLGKTTSSLFQRDSTEKKKSTVVMMPSSQSPGGGGSSGGGNGGGVQIIAVGPTRNEIVNNSMKALITTKLS